MSRRFDAGHAAYLTLNGAIVAFLLLPLGLNALAWLARQYPFGAARVEVFAAPGALLLVAAGVPPALAWCSRRGRRAPPVTA